MNTSSALPPAFPAGENLLSELAHLVRRTALEFLKARGAEAAPGTQPLDYEKSPAFRFATQMPLFDDKARSVPLSAITRPGEWTGKRYPLPAGFLPGKFFAFKINDFSMQPFFRPGTVVFADIRKKIRRDVPSTVVLKLQGQAPVCCVYLLRGTVCFVRKGHSKAEWERVKRSSVEWCFRVVRSANPVS